MSIFVERDWDRCCSGLFLNMGTTHMLSLEPVEDYRFLLLLMLLLLLLLLILLLLSVDFVVDFVVVVLFSRFPSCALSFCSCSHFCKCIIIICICRGMDIDAVCNLDHNLITTTTATIITTTTIIIAIVNTIVKRNPIIMGVELPAYIQTINFLGIR